MDKPVSVWGCNAAGEKIKTSVPVLAQEEIDQIDSRYIREVYQEARDRAERETKLG